MFLLKLQNAKVIEIVMGGPNDFKIHRLKPHYIYLLIP